MEGAIVGLVEHFVGQDADAVGDAWGHRTVL